MKPRVSVLVPVFNAAGTLATCLRSLQRQEFPEFECILVDDGSSDGSAERMHAFARHDERFIVVKSPHVGIPSILTTGLERCGGEFIARMDADDWMHRSRLALQLQAFEQDPGLDLVGTHVRFFPRAGVEKGMRAYEGWLHSMETADDVARERFIECPLAHPTWMLRRAALDRLGGYRDEGWPEDYDLLLRLIESGGRAGVVPRRLLGWAQHPNRLSRTNPRYSLDAFTRCRASYLATGPLRESDRFLLWGFGQTGRALRRALASHRKQLSGLIEVHRGRLGQKIHGAPVVAPEDIDQLPRHPLIVSVAGLGPRTIIRERLSALGRIEGRDYFCAA